LIKKNKEELSFFLVWNLKNHLISRIGLVFDEIINAYGIKAQVLKYHEIFARSVLDILVTFRIK